MAPPVLALGEAPFLHADRGHARRGGRVLSLTTDEQGQRCFSTPQGGDRKARRRLQNAGDCRLGDSMSEDLP
jgi:hypothetical protein